MHGGLATNFIDQPTVIRFVTRASTNTENVETNEHSEVDLSTMKSSDAQPNKEDNLLLASYNILQYEAVANILNSYENSATLLCSYDTQNQNNYVEINEENGDSVISNDTILVADMQPTVKENSNVLTIKLVQLACVTTL